MGAPASPTPVARLATRQLAARVIAAVEADEAWPEPFCNNNLEIARDDVMDMTMQLAQEIVALQAERDDANAEIERLRDLESSTVRDAVRQLARANAEVERLRVIERSWKQRMPCIEADRDNLREWLAEMTAARDEACDMLERTIDELAEHEDDPDMMHGHRLALAGWRKVGGGE